MNAEYPHRPVVLLIGGILLLIGIGGAGLAARPSGASPAAARPAGAGSGGYATASAPGAGAPQQGTPTPTPALPDLVPHISWACLPLQVHLTTECANCANPQPVAGPSTMRFENHAGDYVDFPVPGLTYTNTTYTVDCVIGTCVPNAWISALPFTLTVDIFNQVIESDETNNVAVLGIAPPPCPAPSPTFTDTPGPSPTPVTPSATPSATPTGLLPTSTTTVVPPTATPSVTATATVCPVQFTDVLPSDPFYPYIRCLACRGILSGYTTSPPCAVAPCFNGGATITRGQAAKIVVTAAGFTDVIPSTQQTFSDVPPSSPFWLYIERAYLHNVLAGYDGVCALYHYSPPCFLTGNSITRGQMSKIDANAIVYSDPIPSTQQTFADVPPSDPFWLYIERVSLHGVISGYSTSPPCSGGVPCFLPGNNLTRNQGAKIVTNTFYPACQTPAR